MTVASTTVFVFFFLDERMMIIMQSNSTTHSIDLKPLMKAAVYYENGGPEVLRYEEVPAPVCPPDGVLVDVEVISVEGGDTIHREIGRAHV